MPAVYILHVSAFNVRMAVSISKEAIKVFILIEISMQRRGERKGTAEFFE
jgi:hypothetical protein